ncbi:MAG: 30S ribosomal protein S15 [Chloroflexi bacterium]|nr:30S ribosomal protein S15 [Chloroflexota bacterium]
MIPKEKKEGLVHQFAVHEKDTGSTAVQVALLTERISQLAEHLKANRHDHSSRRGLMSLVGHRGRLLAYMARTEPVRYREVVAQLGLRK